MRTARTSVTRTPAASTTKEATAANVTTVTAATATTAQVKPVSCDVAGRVVNRHFGIVIKYLTVDKFNYQTSICFTRSNRI